MPSAVYGQQPVKLEGVITDTAITAALLFTFVKYSGDNKVTPCVAATDVPCGVVQALAAVNDPVEVVALGNTQIQVGASIAAGKLIGTNGSGQAVALTPGTDVTKYVVGTMKRTASATTAGNFAEASVNCISPARAA
jgi:hypothetical protein